MPCKELWCFTKAGKSHILETKGCNKSASGDSETKNQRVFSNKRRRGYQGIIRLIDVNHKEYVMTYPVHKTNKIIRGLISHNALIAIVYDRNTGNPRFWLEPWCITRFSVSIGTAEEILRLLNAGKLFEPKDFWNFSISHGRTSRELSLCT